MDLKQLHYFCTIVEEGQVTRAAKRLHMSQPPLSHQLKLLEEEFGVTLFEREGRKMELTASGRILYQRAKQLISQVNDTVTAVRETSNGIRGKLAIGANKSCFSHLSERIRLFRESFPHVTFQLREGDTYHISELLKKREIELGIVRLPVDGDDFSMLPLPGEPYIFVLPKDWVRHTNNQASINMKQISEYPLLLLHRANGVGQFELVLSEFKRHGLAADIVCECPDPSMILSLVAKGVGASIVPASTLHSIQMSDILAFTIEDAAIESNSAVIWLQDRYLSKSAIHLLKSFENLRTKRIIPTS
ncbi:LysR family transcriptional regulator [Peribacillus sp. SCS-155]|uniref:LysR family transcriptional regulator n=1 Tax=Peribacillus sedimenti TaxID=3115297 RepID=UPI003905BBF4